MGTKIGVCVNCQEEAVIAAFGLCYACYRADDRASVARKVDRHGGAIRKDHDKLFTAHAEMMRGMRRSKVNREDVRRILMIMQPYWEPIAPFLRDSVPVNEQKEKLFTVHSGGGSSESANVNAEQKNEAIEMAGTSRSKL